MLAAFDRDGYVAIPNVVPGADLGRRSDDAAIVRIADAVEADARVRTVIAHHLGPSWVRRDAVYRAPAHGGGGQTLHVDTPERVVHGDWHVLAVVVALVDFTAEGGATRFVPGSHREPDPGFRATSPEHRHPGEIALTGPAGTAFVFSGHALHAAGRNRTAGPRHSLLLSYVRERTRA